MGIMNKDDPYNEFICIAISFSDYLKDENKLIVAKQLISLLKEDERKGSVLELWNGKTDNFGARIESKEILNEKLKDISNKLYEALYNKHLANITNEKKFPENEQKALSKLDDLLKDDDTPVAIKKQIGDELKNKFINGVDNNKKQSIKKIMDAHFKDGWKAGEVELKSS